MSVNNASTEQGLGRALDERLYGLSDEERAFFKEQTEIRDDEELKTHILELQAEAYKVCRTWHGDDRVLMTH